MEPRRHVEQFEVIERHVTESRRPISSVEALNYIPTTQVRTSGETFVTTGEEADRTFRDEADRRFQLTGERDVSRDASFGPTSMSPLRENPLLQSTPERSYSASAINNYGYDVHEVQTSAGGARVVQTHGSGNIWDGDLANNSSDLMHDRSIDVSGRPLTDIAYGGAISPTLSGTRIGGQPQSILKNTDPNRQFNLSDENSLNRKDSYKRMQENHFENASVYAPSSQATMISRSSKRPEKWAFNKRASTGTNDCFSTFQSWISNIFREIKTAERTPALICGLLLVLLFILFLIILLIMFLSAAFSPYTVSTFLMYPPVCEECLKRNPAATTYRPPSKLFVHVRSPSEIDFEMVGNHPLKSNSYTVADFSTGYIAIADHALTDTNGRHTHCYLMKLDRDAMPNMDVVMDAIASTDHEVHSEFGWQEHWQYVVKAIDATQATSKFHSTINDCLNAKWYMLEHTVYTKDSSCTACYDFCFPDYAVQRRQKYEDAVTLGIRRLNCFRHYVPEWINYQIESDEEGGHWQYPRKPQDTQRDAYNNWVSWTPVGIVGRPDIRQRFDSDDFMSDSVLEPHR
ncbi:BRICHOS domain-containing protein C09F5.1 [Aphelenchoides besseyi]|nr:BRICHOS domain-containing protein C09F5.1 [Aphelenchoides besseyi]KAI6201067.1 BRICHOS domain-containing protein C09F5.1 [Aphelenchoides besseyi]